MAGNVADLLQFLIAHHVLLDCWWCERCGELCSRDLSRLAFRCDRRHVGRGRSRSKRVWRCRYFKSMLCGSWFSQVRLSVSKVCQLICLWLNLPFPRQSIIETELGVSSRTVVDWSSFCREVCIFWVDKESVILGGPGVVVEIDEAKIGKRKYNRGRWIDGQWVFGGFERGTKNCFLVPVPSRGSDVLLEIIKQWIRPGTIVVSDCWKSYDCLHLEGFVHEKVNHSTNFVDPRSGAHTQNIERTWREVRGNIPRFGRREHHMVGYLAEYLFKRKYSHYAQRVHAFFTAVGQLYTPAPAT